ncbi:MAG: FG-GAP repeat domain-containing protein [Gemmataceae bacterium]
MGNGNGTFLGQQTFATGDNPRSVTLGDVNGDGRLDITIANYSSNNASVLLNSLAFTGQTATVQNSAPTPTPTPTAPLVTGTPPPSSGGSSTVALYDPVTGEENGTAVPFPGFSGPIKVVSGDFNNDGVADIIAGAGFGGGPAIAILDSQTGQVLEAFFAFDTSFTGGVFVAVQDVNNDGFLDIIAGAGPGGGPEVRIFNGRTLNVLRAFYAYDEAFTGGVSVASIDFNNDGILDLVTGAGPGGAPHVKVFDGANNAIISQWYAYPTYFTGGVFVAAGDIGNDGNIEVVTGAGPTGSPVVAVWNPYTGTLLSQFYAYAEDFTGGVRVGVSDGNGDGTLDLLTGAGPGGGPEVKVFSFPALDLLFSFYSGEPTNTGGVYVG